MASLSTVCNERRYLPKRTEKFLFVTLNIYVQEIRKGLALTVQRGVSLTPVVTFSFFPLGTDGRFEVGGEKGSGRDLLR